MLLEFTLLGPPSTQQPPSTCFIQTNVEVFNSNLPLWKNTLVRCVLPHTFIWVFFFYWHRMIYNIVWTTISIAHCTMYIFWQLTETDSSVYSRCGARTPADWVRWRVRGGKWHLGGPQRLTYFGRDRHQQWQAGGHLLFTHPLVLSTPGWNNRDHPCEAPTKAGWGSEVVKPGMRSPISQLIPINKLVWAGGDQQKTLPACRP